MYGIWAPISAMVNPAAKVITPPNIQAKMAMVEEPALSKIEACLKKIPDPIMVPTTIEMADQNPSDRLSSF